jgi:hypothetical protein
MEGWWIPAFAGGRASFFHTLLSFVSVCVLLREARRRRLSADGIRFSLPCPRFDGVSSIVGGRVEVCLRRISWDSVDVCLRWIHVDLVFVRLCSCVYRLDPSDLHFSSLAADAVLMRWSYGALARRLPDCLLQQGLPGSDEGGAKMAARLRLAPVQVVVARWSTDLDVFFLKFWCFSYYLDS